MTIFLKKNLFLIIIICLTLGLAPFFPEPHIVGKINWIIGGGHGMNFMDYFDLILHGTPWILLILAIYVKIRART